MDRTTYHGYEGVAQSWYCLGGAKTDNVLIDGENDSWIIDFAGGNTRGWVDENLANTIKGDQQGLLRIIAHVVYR